MRSLPPPRITRARRWKRIKRALKSFFEQGYIADFSVFYKRCQKNHYTISKIRRTRFTYRFVTTERKGVVKRANRGWRFARVVGRHARKVTMPGLRRGLRASGVTKNGASPGVDISVRF
ncbi:hypothetical protein Cantr_09878 [Candida viswanathii]|uniref:Uncharacterized protein n=1 Tax=Candida viswanathii TaxID=5486 RepID=A0A367YCE6_9ASCO|nr:hypothetical protein Cantr_09878 [Candida viswanathii]